MHSFSPHSTGFMSQNNAMGLATARARQLSWVHTTWVNLYLKVTPGTPASSLRSELQFLSLFRKTSI
jgi:hypothetical protein